MTSMILSDTAILNFKSSDYGCIISLISKNEAINLLPNSDLTKKHYKLKREVFEGIHKMKIYIYITFSDTEI